MEFEARIEGGEANRGGRTDDPRTYKRQQIEIRLPVT